MKPVSIILVAVYCICCAHSAYSQIKTTGKYPRSEKEASAIAAQVLRQAPIIDGHNDLFAWYFGCAYKKLPKCPQDIADYRLDTLTKGQTDIPRLRKGGVGAVQLNVYSDSLSSFLDAYDLLYRIENRYNKDLKIVSNSDEMRRTMQNGKIAILPMLEGSDRLEGKLSYLRHFYKLGLRCVTFTYTTGVLADGSDDEPMHNGISALGRSMITEMNNLGIIIDMSHISAKAMNDILDITQAPVIFSHSNARHLCDVNRNVPDEILFRLKSNKGIIMLDMVPDHTSQQFAKWVNEGDSIYYTAVKSYPGNKQKVKEVMTVWEANTPRPEVSIADIADHFDYVKKLIGVDYIGIGGDYDGLDYTINEMEDVSCYPKLLTELAKRGWTAAELRKITNENYLRVFSAIEKKSTLHRSGPQKKRTAKTPKQQL